MNETKLIVDFSSVIGAYLYIRDEEFGIDVEYEGETFHIPNLEVSLERFQHTVSNLDIQPVDFIVVRDPGGLSKVRTKILKTYKQKPRKTPPELAEARTALHTAAIEWLKSQGAIIATPKNFTEADDLVNELAKRLPKSIIWTRDRDLLACPTDVLFSEKTGLEWNPVKFPVEKYHIHVYRTIVLGDSSDNVASCKGFGEKAWDKMVEQFGEEAISELDTALREKRLDELSHLVAEFKPFKLLIDQAEDLYKAYQVLSFFPVPAHMVKWEGGVLKGEDTLVTAANYDQVMAQLKQMKFDYSVIDYEGDTCQESRDWCKSSGSNIDVMGQEITGMGLRIKDKNFYFSVDHADTDNITLDQLEAVLEFLWGKPIYAHNGPFENILTYNHFGALLPKMSDTLLMGSYVDENRQSQGLKSLSYDYLGYQQASYLETLNGKSGMREISGLEVLRYGLDDVICTDGIKRLFEVILQYEGTLDVFHKVEDDALYFTTLCFIHGVDFDEEAFRELKSTNDRNIEESWAKLSDMLLDLDWPGKEFRPLEGLNMDELNRAYKAIHGHEIPEVSAVKMAIQMMDDRQLAQMVEQKDMEKINDYYLRHWKPAAEFSVRSPKQMSRLLYEVLKIPVRIRNAATDIMKKAGKQGNPASNEAAIMNAIAYKDTEHVELLKLLLEYKGYLTKQSLFLDKYPQYVHWKTGKIHASLRQSNTTTRRYTCSDPNMQQLPKKTGKEFRNMLKSREGYSFVSLDFTGQELRLAADDSRDPDFLACYIGDNKKDPHSMTGLRIAQKATRVELDGKGNPVLDESGNQVISHPWAGFDYDTFVFQKEMGVKEMDDFRTLGKKINFTAQYGAMAPKVAQTLCITPSEAQVYLTARENAFPRLIERVEEWHQICRKQGYATTMLGARRHLGGHMYYGSKKDFELQAADRLAYSMRIQGSAAEMTKLAAGMMAVGKDIFDDGTIIPFITIHDEIVLQVRDDIIAEKMPMLMEIMCQHYADMIVPMETEPEVGKNLGRLKKWAKIQMEMEEVAA